MWMPFLFQMISVERVIEYTDLEKEAPWEYQRRPPPGWPHEGVIVFDNMNFTYSLDGPLVLKHLTALIRSREKVGLNRLVPLEPPLTSKATSACSLPAVCQQSVQQ